MSNAVLIVEDDVDAREMLRVFLEDAGYATITAGNGAEALRVLQNRRPALILLDIQMPVMDGWAFRQRQLADARLADIPVVAITAFFDVAKVTDQLGITCLRKPLDFDALVAEVEAAVGRQAGRA